MASFEDPDDTPAAAAVKARYAGDGPPCTNCGAITVRAGSCYSCRGCGSSSGCG